MNYFHTPKHLSEIIEDSAERFIVIFKHSSKCNASNRLEENIIKKIDEKTIIPPVYKVIVQDQSVLSQKIEEMFEIKHETPQIIVLLNNKVIYTAHHDDINLDNLKNIE